MDTGKNEKYRNKFRKKSATYDLPLINTNITAHVQ